MARPRSTPTDLVEAKLDQIAARLDEIAKLLAISIARDRSLQDAVDDLDAAGLRPTRVAELLGTSPGYAKVAADRARKKRKARSKG